MSGFLQEQDGSRSSRRLLAITYAVASLALFGIAAWRDTQWAFWAGVATTSASIVYPILTTAQEIKQIIAAAKGIGATTEKRGYEK